MLKHLKDIWMKRKLSIRSSRYSTGQERNKISRTGAGCVKHVLHKKRAPKENHAPLGIIKTSYPVQVFSVDNTGSLLESNLYVGWWWLYISQNGWEQWQLPESLLMRCSAGFNSFLTKFRSGETVLIWAGQIYILVIANWKSSFWFTKVCLDFVWIVLVK